MSGDVNNGGWTLAIDFGTTATVAAALDHSGRPSVIQIDGQREMPSVVFLEEDGQLLVGQTASDLAIGRPDRAIQTPKERLHNQTPVVIAGQSITAIDLTAAVLARTLEAAVAFQGSYPTASRLTYPAMWSGPLKSRLLEAANRADLPMPELVAEPVAAAISYSEKSHLPVGAAIAVFDLGGGTFDTVVLIKRPSGFSIAGRPAGDATIGGELFDELLMNEVGTRLDPSRWEQLLVSDDPAWRRSARRMRNDCKRAKEALTRHPVTDVIVSLPDGVAEARITQDEFETVAEPYITETAELLQRCVARADLDASELHAVYLTGGASRIPLVRRTVEAAFPHTAIVQQGDPKAATALGALMAMPTATDQDVVPGSGRTSADAANAPRGSSDRSAPNTPQPPTPPRRVETANADSPAQSSAETVRSTPPMPPVPPQRPRRRASTQPKGRIIFLVSGAFALLAVAFVGASALDTRQELGDAAVAPIDAEVAEAEQPSETAAPTTTILGDQVDPDAPTPQTSGPDFSAIIELPEPFTPSDAEIDPALICNTTPVKSAPDQATSQVGVSGELRVQTFVGKWPTDELARQGQSDDGALGECREFENDTGEALTASFGDDPFPDGFSRFEDVDRVNFTAWQVTDESGQIVSVAYVASMRRDDHVLGLVMVRDNTAFTDADRELAAQLMDNLVEQAIETFPADS